MQAVYNIAEICARHGITDVVLSPGSRSAPLTLAFARHPTYRGRLRVVPDERAAAFIALGIAQATRRPVVLVCTSGTAGLNYAPAVAEAFFQQIPLLILTADRPPEWIDQLDGQTIRQRNLYGAHAKGAFDFPADTSHADAKWHSSRILNEAIALTRAVPAGPVQVNIPLREPFYPKAGEQMTYEQNVSITRLRTASMRLAELEAVGLSAEVRAAEGRILVVIGQMPPGVETLELNAALNQFIDATGAVVLGDIISNAALALDHPEQILSGLMGNERAGKLQPTLVISCGLSLISKVTKQFLRQHPPRLHFHVQPSLAPAADTFRSLSETVVMEPAAFFEQLTNALQGPLPDEFAYLGSWEPARGRSSYRDEWEAGSAVARKALNTFFEPPPHFTEFAAFRRVLTLLPNPTTLHLANSMAVRYANILGIQGRDDVEVFANRGTSGIDGCTSTAVGAALAQPGRPVVLLTGDVAFFYDRNAFWHNYPTSNLRVVLFNNHGGGIFRLIDGPRQQPELEEFFETRQTLNAENTARDFNLAYFPVSSFHELDAALPVFFATETGAAILEIFTDSRTNAEFFEQYRAAVKHAFSA